MKPKILIVEDEILIADTIKRYLKRMDYDVVGIAISYEEAIDILETTKPDLALLDIRLNSQKTGIDLAQYLKDHYAIPYIFLTSQLDPTTLTAAKATLPSGYLSKPIQKESLYATIEIALFNYQAKVSQPSSNKTFITLPSGTENYKIAIEDILYIQADHVYSNIVLASSDRLLLVRKPLRTLKELLPNSIFIQPHRSFLVNIHHIESWDKSSIKIGDASISISRNNKDAVFSILQQL